MRIWKLTIAAAALAAAASAGCGDDAGDAAVSRNLDARRAGPPDLAAVADTPWPDDAGAGDVDDGRQLYLATCAACHGAGGQGLPHQGPDLRASRFLARSTDAELLTFFAAGRPVGDPRNTTGLPMPPRGGNPSLTDRHLGQIVRYLRTVSASGGEAEAGSAAIPVHPEERP